MVEGAGKGFLFMLLRWLTAAISAFFLGLLTIWATLAILLFQPAMVLAPPDAAGRLLDVRDAGTLDFTPAAANRVCRAVSRRGDLVDRDPPESTFAFCCNE